MSDGYKILKTLLISDLDGTLLTSRECISPYSMEHLNTWIDGGLSFTYATARSLNSAAKACWGLRQNLPVILYNGAIVMQPQTRTMLYHNPFNEGQLWFLDRSAQELELVADGVIDCAYSDWSKTSYHNDLWYITSDQTLHREDRLGTEDRGEDYWYPRRARAIDASNGYYLAQLEDGSYLWGYGSQEGAVPIPVTGGEGSLLWLYYAILDGEGALHVGRVPPIQGDAYHAGMEPLADRIIPHPAA